MSCSAPSSQQHHSCTAQRLSQSLANVRRTRATQCGQSFHLSHCMRCRDDAESDHMPRKGKQQALTSAPERDKRQDRIHHNACMKHSFASTDQKLTDRPTAVLMEHHGNSKVRGTQNNWHFTFRFQHGAFTECFGSEVTGVSAVVFSISTLSTTSSPNSARKFFDFSTFSSTFPTPLPRIATGSATTRTYFCAIFSALGHLSKRHVQ